MMHRRVILKILMFLWFGMMSCEFDIHYYNHQKIPDLLSECKKSSKNLFLYLYADNCGACEDMDNHLTSSRLKEVLNNHYVCVKSNVNQEQKLAQILNSTSTPTFAVIDPSYNILYLQRGITSDVILFEALSNIANKKDVPFPHYSGKLYTSGHKLYELLGNVLYACYRLDDIENLDQDYEKIEILLKNSIAIEPYFMNQYLLSKLYLLTGDTIGANTVQEDLFKVMDKNDRRLYADLIEHLWGQDSLNSSNPSIELKQERIILNDLKFGKKTRVVVEYENKGKIPLNIRSIDISCGCIKGYWSQKPLLPHHKDSIEFIIAPTSRGKFMKRAAVTSNSDDLAIITFSGDVK